MTDQIVLDWLTERIITVLDLGDEMHTARDMATQILDTPGWRLLPVEYEYGLAVDDLVVTPILELGGTEQKLAMHADALIVRRHKPIPAGPWEKIINE